MTALEDYAATIQIPKIPDSNSFYSETIISEYKKLFENYHLVALSWLMKGNNDCFYTVTRSVKQSHSWQKTLFLMEDNKPVPIRDFQYKIADIGSGLSDKDILLNLPDGVFLSVRFSA